MTLVFNEEVAAENIGTVTSWFIKVKLNAGIEFTPRDDLFLKSNKTDGAWDTLLTRLVDKERYDLLHIEVVSVNLQYDFQPKTEVVDDELDDMLEVKATPLFAQKTKSTKAPVMFYVNCLVSSDYVSGKPLHASLAIRKDTRKDVLSALLKLSKELEPSVSAECTSLNNPRIKEVYELQDISAI